MSGLSENKGRSVSLADRLRSTDKFLTEMRSVLASMDEIDGLRRQRGEAVTDEFGGYKRSSVTKLVEGLEKQRDSILAEIAKEEQRNAELVRRAQEEAAARRRAEAQNAELARRAETEAEARRRAEEESAKAQEARLVAVEKSVRESEERRLAQAQKEEEERRSENPVASFRRGDPTLALESMYTGLSMDIEKLRDDILQEMRYTYKQDMAIYDDLSSLIESVKKSDIDRAAMDESLRPIREKVETLAPVDYEKLADGVAARVLAGGIDYEVLAQHVADIMAANAPAPQELPAPQEKNEELTEIERKIDELQSVLSGAVSVKQMPEFRKLDELIAKYLSEGSYELIPDILVAADAAKNTANRYIVSGNTLRGETMLSDIRTRLTRVVVSGSNACTAVADAVSAHNLAVTYSPEAMEAFRQTCIEFEQSSAIPQDEIAARLRRAKYALFGDADADAADEETMAEMLAAREAAGGVPDRAQIDAFNNFKRELMSFNLSYFVDLTPPLPEQREQGASADTQAILDAIARLGARPQAAEPRPAAAEPVLAQAVPQPAAVRKPRVLRPAVSAKDNQVEKTDQPLRTVKRKIDLTRQAPDGISKQVVEDLALRIANSRVK